MNNKNIIITGSLLLSEVREKIIVGMDDKKAREIKTSIKESNEFNYRYTLFEDKKKTKTVNPI